jgi:hypothetical protein
MLTLPPTLQLAVGQSAPVCAFKRFGNGAVVAYTADRATCDPLYQQVPAAARALVTPAQQAHTDSAVACVTWSGGLPWATLAAVPCASAVRVTAVLATGLSPFGTPMTTIRLAAK